MNKIKLVAHRGFAAKFPENSMSSFCAAIKQGAEFIELDIQLSADHTPVVIHDENLQRTGGEPLNILTTQWHELSNKTIGEQERFGDKFKNEPLMTLSTFATLLKENPQIKAFVEIKEESVEKFGEKIVVENILDAISEVKSQCTIISFDSNVLFYVQKNSNIPIGFVMHKYNNEHKNVAQQMNPDMLICNYKKIPDEEGSLWPGQWQWFIYEVVDVEIANKWFKRGIEYIETMEVEYMMEALGSK